MAGREGKLQALSAREEQQRLSKEELLRPRHITETVFMNSLGGEVVFQSMTHRVRKEIQDETKAGTPEFDDDLMTMLSIVESVVEPKLTRDDIEKLREQDASIIDEFSLHIATLNMFGRGEELKKESDETPNSDSDSS